MKMLFAVQATGNGHVSRAGEIIPYLKKHGELDVLLSGYQLDIDTGFEVKYRKKGISFIFGSAGGIDYWKTFKHLDSRTFLKEIISFPIEKYDLIINDYEPITAWAAHFTGIPIISLSHQCSFVSPAVPRPDERDRFGEFILKNYAPCPLNIGFHFKKYDDFIHTPVIRKKVREIVPGNAGHYTVYLPAFNDRTLIGLLGKIRNVRWEIFSKHSKRSYTEKNFRVIPVNQHLYYKSLASCEGLITGGGFESPAEALYLGKKLMVIPMKGQYEQQCNAAALTDMGVSVRKDLDLSELVNWIDHTVPVKIDYPDITGTMVESLFKKFDQAFPGIR